MADDTLPDDPAARKRALEQERHRRRYAADPDYFKRNAARWAKANPERAREIRKASQERNKERRNALARERYDPEKVRAYQLANKERLREYHREYHIKNAEKICARTRTWVHNNNERKKQNDKRYYRENIDAIKVQSKEYRKKNKAIISVRNKLNRLRKLSDVRETDRKRYAANPGPKKAAAGARNAHLKHALLNMSPQEVEVIKAFYKACPSGMHVDHIVPLKPCVDCGSQGFHEITNLRYLTSDENQSKSNRCASCWSTCKLKLIKNT